MPGRYHVVVERLIRADRTCAIAAATMASDFNSEFTVILSSISDAMLALEPGHPARPALFELKGAAERCALKCRGVLALSSRHGIQPARAPLEAVVQL
jgi:hypothetical protein